MKSVTIYGSSDDLVEIEATRGVAGRDEYSYGSDEWSYIAASDGSVIRIGYCLGESEIWQVERVREGSAKFTVRPCAEDNYTEHGELEGDITWIRYMGKDEAAAGDLAGFAKTDPDAIKRADAILKAMSGASEGEFDDWWSDLEERQRGTTYLALVLHSAGINVF